MVDPTHPNPYRTRAFGPADHGLMIPAGHVVLWIGILLLLAPIALLIQSIVLSLWSPTLASHGTIVTEVLMSAALIAGMFLVGLSRHYNWERFGFWMPVRTDYLFVGGILAISIFIQPLFMFGFDAEGATDLRDTFFTAYHPQGALLFELLVFAALVILAPLLEEMVFRGLFFGWARQRLGGVGRKVLMGLWRRRQKGGRCTTGVSKVSDNWSDASKAVECQMIDTSNCLMSNRCQIDV